MRKFLSMFSLFTVVSVLIPITSLAAEAEEVAAEPSSLLITFLTVMSIATLLMLYYLCARDNG